MYARVRDGLRLACNDVVKLSNFASLFVACNPPLGKGCLAKISLSLSISKDDVGISRRVRFCKGSKHDCAWMCKDQVCASCPFTRRSSRSSRPPPPCVAATERSTTPLFPPLSLPFLRPRPTVHLHTLRCTPSWHLLVIVERCVVHLGGSSTWHFDPETCGQDSSTVQIRPTWTRTTRRRRRRRCT